MSHDDLSSSCTDDTLTLANLTQLVNNMEDWDDFRRLICIPDSKYEALKQQHPDGAQWKKAACVWYLTEHPAPSWSHVATALYIIEEHAVLDVLRMHYLKGQWTL